ncbi:hypothetical protein BC628DRAFT_1422376 [Trametes gibbosa]|nr:hypothetical protein BC628DRAFT_1422376 [Trametes gibbosa]
MSAIQSNIPIARPSVSESLESSSTFVPSPQPQPPAEPVAPVTKLADLRQLTLENGRIIDLPVSVLQDSPPKPVEFLHLQHHFEATRGTPVDISACDTADEAIDVLADEIEAMRLLLHGYVVNFKRYVDRFEATHTELRKEVISVAVSYDGLTRLIGPAHESARVVEEQFVELRKKLTALPVGGAQVPPPKITKVRGGLHNPPLSAGENRTIQARERERFEEGTKIHGLLRSKKKLVDAGLLKEILEPTLLPKPQAKKHRKKLPFSHELMFKIDKVVEDVEAARQQLQVAQTVTSRNLAVLRYLEDESVKDGKELWAWYEVAERWATTAGKVSKMNERRIEAYDKWATDCAENAAATPPEASSDAAPTTEISVPLDTPDAQPSESAVTGINGDLQESQTPLGSPDDTMLVDGDVYAVTLDLECEKPYDELTHEEAISVLKSLPIRVHFVPYVPPAETVQDEKAIDASAKSTEVPESPCPSPASKPPVARPAAPPESDEISPPQSEREPRCAPKPRSRKRARQDADADGEADAGSGAAADKPDPRPKAGGSSIKKKKRGGNA